MHQSRPRTRDALLVDEVREQLLLRQGEQNPYAHRVVAGSRPDYILMGSVVESTSSGAHAAEEAKKIFAYFIEDQDEGAAVQAWIALDAPKGEVAQAVQ